MSTQKTEPTTILPFLFGDHLIRTENRIDGPWFVHKDVCQALCIVNHNDALTYLDEDEKGVGITDPLSPGGRQQLGMINESGLYTLIFKSRKKEAQVFRKWVTSEVLPTIRRTGNYSPAHQAYLGLLREQIALGVPPALAARAAIRLCPAVLVSPRTPKTADAAPDERTQTIQLLRDQMTPGRFYGIEELSKLLPAGHELHTPDKPTPKRKGHGPRTSTLDYSIASSLGKYLAWAARENLLEKKRRSRNAAYGLPAIVSISTVQ